MTIALVSGGLAFVLGLLVLRPMRPLSTGGGRAQAAASVQDEGRHLELLRQLRDLDDDFADGKLSEADHARLRGPVERAAAASLDRKPERPATAAGSAAPAARPEPGTKRPAGRGAGWGWRRWAATLLVLAGAAGGITVLLVHSVSSRAAGQAITGDSVPGASVAPGRPHGSAPTTAPTPQGGKKAPTARQLAAVAAAEARVKRNPQNVSAHLALAQAYTAAGASQLATVEYLAVTRLDPANPEANTSLALLAFQVGRAAQAKAMVDRVLAANPSYSEALYVRGVISLIGLKQPAAAARDFNTYLSIAPFGSHRTAALTLLALAKVQGHQAQGHQ